jgi:histidinol-phosphate aminotransferase
MNLQKLTQRYTSVPLYKPSEDMDKLYNQFRENPSKIIKLNANENYFVSKSFIIDLIKQAASELDPRLYPLKEVEQLKEKISEINGVIPEGIILASGGDQLIEQLLSAILGPGESVLAVAPTFSMYPRTCITKGLGYKEKKIGEDFKLKQETILSKSDKETGAIVLCNPNNPTGNQFSLESVISLIDGYDGIVILDEAYAEYGKYSLAREAEKRENLIVLRTFSKAYGLAGLRLGYATTNPELAAIMNERYMMPYPVSSLSLKTGLKALQNQEYFMETIQHSKKAREELLIKLNRINGVKAFHSDTNFILFTTQKPMDQVYSGLLEKGMIIKKVGNVPGYKECLRVTVAPPQMSKRFTTSLEEVLK